MRDSIRPPKNPDRPPIEWIPLYDKLGEPHIVYRWEFGSTEHRPGGIALIKAYDQVEHCVRRGLDDPHLAAAYRTRWDAINEMCVDIKVRKGLVNPLICWPHPDGRLFSLVGNQRLCAIRALGWRIAPVWQVSRWGDESNLVKQFYHKVPSKHF